MQRRRALTFTVVLASAIIPSIYIFSLAQNFKRVNVFSTSSWHDDWMSWASTAWKYYTPGVGVNPTTGLHYGNKYWHRFTDWDLGIYIMAIIDAERLGLISRAGEWGVDYRLEKILRFLETRKLTEERIPYLVYDSETGDLPPEVTPQPTNPSDSGKLLIALDTLRRIRPDLKFRIESIVSSVNYTLLAQSREFGSNNAYMYYVAQGFHAFGLDTPYLRELANLGNGQFIDIYGEKIPMAYMTSEPFVSAILEFNDVSWLYKNYSYGLYRVQEKRHINTGNLTAFSEGSYPAPYYYAYEWVTTSKGEKFVIYTQQGIINEPAVIHTRIGLAFHAIYNTNYSRTLVEYLTSRTMTDEGFYEGVLENGSVLEVLSDKTNGMILAAARYALSKLDLRWYPEPFIKDRVVNNTLVVIGESSPHEPVGKAHTIDTLGGMLISSSLGLVADSGALKSGMDGWFYTYDPSTGAMSLRDTDSNLILVGGPGVNGLAYYYNNLIGPLNESVLPVVFLWDPGGGYLKSQLTGNIYRKEYTQDGQLQADYGVIQLIKDPYGRYVMLVYGLGGESTLAAAEVLRNYADWDLTGSAVVLKYFSSTPGGPLDTISIVERCP